ncbi:extracellular with 3 TSP1 domains and an EGF domain [Cryptosporidium xiaoi]|uniref:Extracellular with 3 TSP1 domains and an EGF domain n=1 Tax=Cryptosporidium xiaoi TaxID=659607 RepID=A0AAV9XZU2_9CRYT
MLNPILQRGRFHHLYVAIIAIYILKVFPGFNSQIADFPTFYSQICSNPYTFGYSIDTNTDIDLIDDDIWPLNQILSAGGSTNSVVRISFATAKKNSYELIFTIYPALNKIERECTYEGVIVRKLTSVAGTSPRFINWPFFDKWVVNFQRQEYGISISLSQGYSEFLYWKRCLNEPVVSVKVEAEDGYLSANQVDCIVSEWSTWSQCSSTCQNGTRSRTRLILRPASFKGVTCPNLIESEGCNISIPCEDCVYSSWSAWGSCSVSCQGGSKTRTRKLIWKSDIKSNCQDPEMDIETCNEQSCPIDCKLSDWTTWSTCSSTCGPGNKIRYRIVFLESDLGGVQCPSEEERTERVSCNNQDCDKSCLSGGICQNGGTCTDIPNSSFTCECAENYYGTFCEHRKYEWWVYFVVCLLSQVFIAAIIKFTFLSRPSSNIVTPVTYAQNNAANFDYMPAFDNNTDISGIY